MTTFKGYISYFIKNLKSTIPDSQLRSFIVKGIGSNVDSASDKDLRNVAFSLYFTHFISLGLCVPVISLLERKKTVKQLKELIEEIATFREKHDLPLSVVFYTESGAVTQHMQKFQEPIEVLKKFISKGEDVKKVAKPSTAKVTAAKKPAAKTVARKPVAKAVVKKTTVPSKSKSLESYTVVELKELAAEAGLPGRSKMKKAELYEALKKMKRI